MPKIQFVKQPGNLIFHRGGEPSAPHPPAVLQAWQASLLPILRFVRQPTEHYSVKLPFPSVTAVLSDSLCSAVAERCIENSYGTDDSCNIRVRFKTYFYFS